MRARVWQSSIQRSLAAAAAMALVASGFWVPAGAFAASELDQSQTTIVGLTIGTGALGQTFTAAKTGLLDRVSIWRGVTQPDAQVQIRTASSGLPTSIVIGSGPITSNAQLEFVDVVIDPPALAVAGTQYALVVTGIPELGFAGDLYPGGTLLLEHSGVWETSPLDLAFRTFVDGFASPTAIGECQGDGWQTLIDAAGHLFKNQGDCISYVVTGGRSGGAGQP